MRRTFTAEEIARILASRGDEIELDNGLKAIRSAMKDRPRFMMERDGKGSGFGLNHYLEDANATELAELSEILWTKFSPDFIGTDLDAELTPESLKGEYDEDILIPDDLRESTDPARRVLDDLLTPSRLIDIIQNPGLARKLADGIATPKEKLEAELTPDELIDGVEDKSLEGQLTPDNLRTEK